MCFPDGVGVDQDGKLLLNKRGQELIWITKKQRILTALEDAFPNVLQVQELIRYVHYPFNCNCTQPVCGFRTLYCATTPVCNAVESPVVKFYASLVNTLLLHLDSKGASGHELPETMASCHMTRPHTNAVLWSKTC